MGIPHGGHTGKTVKHDHPLGKNPGDVVEVWNHVKPDPRFPVDRTPHRSYKWQPAQHREERVAEIESNPLGRNPGDVIQVPTNLMDKIWEEYQRRLGYKGEFQGKASMLDKQASYRRMALNAKAMRETMNEVLDALNVDGETRKIIVKWWHDHSVHPLGRNPGDFWRINTQPSDDYWCPDCKNFVKQRDMECVRCGVKVVAHFAVYPEELCVKPIKSSCPPGGVVLDPMCGRRTTLAVAKKLGLRFIGIDINPDYCEMTTKWLSGVEWPLEAYA